MRLLRTRCYLTWRLRRQTAAPQAAMRVAEMRVAGKIQAVINVMRCAWLSSAALIRIGFHMEIQYGFNARC